MSSNDPPIDALPVEVNGQVIDPNEVYAKDAKNTDYLIIGFRKILNIEEEEELHKLQVTILEDLGSDNFLCFYPLNDLSPIRSKEFVRQVDVYRNKYKIPATLQSLHQEELSTSTTTTGDVAAAALEPEYFLVDILTHKTIKDDEFEDLKKFIEDKSGVSTDEMDFAPGQIRLQVTADKLVEIAQDDRVRIIEEVLQTQLMSSNTYDPRPIVRGDIAAPASSYSGKGQIITVTDTGFDRGTPEGCHPAFTGRVLSLIPLARRDKAGLSPQQKTNDPHGHGTHVSGIIIGTDFDTSKGLVGGIAPDAKIIVQSIYLDWKSECVIPTNLNEVFEVPYGQGSRIFSNSWGVGSDKGKQPDYGVAAQTMDDFIRNNPEAFLCFSAGNSNYQAPGQPTVGIHAGAKNVLTVGATGNLAAPDQMYTDSSMGPSKEQRMKPDIVAPGVDIYSALSAMGKSGGGEIATAATTPSTKWRSYSGTSQAAPLVSGCAAILREALQEGGFTNPPGALLKALLINGADQLPGISRNAQGHGRVNLLSSLAMIQSTPIHSGNNIASPSIIGGTLIGNALQQDGDYEFTLAPLNDNNTTSSHTHFKITMVYNDIGNKQIQNNLNLFITDLNTNEAVPGNDKSLTDPDVQNNVEQIILNYIPQHGLKVKVHAQKILALHDQDYVLAWSVFTPFVARTA